MVEWLSRLKHLGRRHRGEDSDPSSAVHWIPASKNPFGIEVLDCRSVTQTMVSSTGDRKIAETYARLRSCTGREYRGQEPKESRTVEIELAYPPVEKPEDGPVFKAEQMEDKWDIYLYDSLLYFCRSWTGVLAYRAQFNHLDDRSRFVRIDFASQRHEQTEDAVGAVDFLIKSHLFGAVVPHPLSRSLPRDPYKLALFSFSQYGRRCMYGSFSDTAKVPIVDAGA